MSMLLITSTLILNQISVPECEALLRQHESINQKSADLLVELKLQQMTRWRPATDELIAALERDFEQRRAEMQRLAKDVARARKTELVPVAEAGIWQIARDVATRKLKGAEKELAALRADMVDIEVGPPGRTFGFLKQLSPTAKAKIPGVERNVLTYRRLLKALDEHVAASDQ